jgi:hypothetical protein
MFMQVILSTYGRNKYCAIKIMKMEEIIEKKGLQLLINELTIMRDIKDAHPFVLNIIGVIQKQVSMSLEIVHL